ncbi:hypothetical protein PHYBLDRAFT_63684 [Phycomyces blakesleeanus NRRL 1555(-)]|uniref:Uncharacterized protein n=1 Tax=Phycomyces blakesleeanus (strain ATCC 8743b / DSM 1359 / FGSC 10004 / NBRC 33097 / NRRL 1555) TaxID=763407 RepID=A0A162WI88_PHYB8|nr:hypothetical protein PHYBLDRAFT_63684 [Phycomyces blakesleeanus NRRL 1555(-)]OAD67315.1 hypothetical protein PHYBLDRAFT_63684 [Phycomyces blakesleeanus NRRL 1555(-)]|eukprot:XP_018285355.1 hypothetical protein PHYBLDRAFT_63684 [Phycomyces blakesleeanus NRRL 1555(-)]
MLDRITFEDIIGQRIQHLLNSKRIQHLKVAANLLSFLAVHNLRPLFINRISQGIGGGVERVFKKGETFSFDKLKQKQMSVFTSTRLSGLAAGKKLNSIEEAEAETEAEKDIQVLRVKCVKSLRLPHHNKNRLMMSKLTPLIDPLKEEEEEVDMLIGFVSVFSFFFFYPLLSDERIYYMCVYIMGI